MAIVTKTFLKWAGNKQKIANIICANLPACPLEVFHGGAHPRCSDPVTQGKGRLVEPFVGSGALLMNSHYSSYLLADSNPTLIALYTHLQQEGADFIKYASSFFRPSNNTQESFTRLRSRFNASSSAREKAALFVYLNRHSFNGLCRFNSRGEFNVPFGRYPKPFFPEAAMKEFLARLQQARVTFLCQDFKATLSQARMGDVIYCDPPYIPLSKTSAFTSYDKNGFSQADQEDLVKCVMATSRLKTFAMVSNHDCPQARKTYKGAKIVTLQVRRNIAARKESRGMAKELLAIYDFRKVGAR